MVIVIRSTKLLATTVIARRDTTGKCVSILTHVLWSHVIILGLVLTSPVANGAVTAFRASQDRTVPSSILARYVLPLVSMVVDAKAQRATNTSVTAQEVTMERPASTLILAPLNLARMVENAKT